MQDTPSPLTPKILAVDLDGTLLRSDMLYETFWAAFGQDWTTPLRAAGALASGGKASLKAGLADAAEIDVTTLPYDEEVLGYIKAWRDQGGEVWLVTASAQALADQIAEHLGVFAGAMGSDTEVNLKGAQKAEALERKWGRDGYAYMGDAAADLPIWAKARKSITVNASDRLRRQAEAVAAEAEHLSTHRIRAANVARALRPHQWLKNLLVFLPLLAAHQFGALALWQGVLAFVAFSLIASSVYVINDLLDLNADRAHARKKRRPFAAGEVPISWGTGMAAALVAGGAFISLFLSMNFMLVMVVYFATTMAYSLVLKRRAVIDICALAALYTLRILAGGAATGLALSPWLLAFSVFFFFSLAAVKRQAELQDGIARGKLMTVGRDYQAGDLPVVSMMAVSSGFVSVLVLFLYIQSSDVGALYSQPAFLGGACSVLLYWISRVVFLTHRGQMHDDPVVFAAKDRVTYVSIVLIFFLSVLAATL